MRVVKLLAAVAGFWAVPASAVTQFVTLTGTLTEQTSSGDPVTFGVGSKITLTASFDSNDLRYWGDTGYQVIGYGKYASESEFKITMDNYVWNSSAEYLDGQPFYEYNNSVTGQSIYMSFPMIFFKDGKIAGVAGKLVSSGNIPMLFLGSGGGFFYESCNAVGCTSQFNQPSLSDTFTFQNRHWYNNTYSGPTFTGKWNFDGIPAPVPEPASWALMILGIGMAGAAMRRRQRQKVTCSLAPRFKRV